MPNWCSVSYTIQGNKEQVKQLHSILKNFNKRKTPLVPNGFGRMWLGCIVHKLGGNYKDIYCRGEVIDFCYYAPEASLQINMEVAWEEPSQFRRFLHSKFPGVEILYRAEECGEEYYVTNDETGIAFPEKYFLDSPEDPEYYCSFEDLAVALTKICGQTPANEEEAFALVNNYDPDNEDDWLSLHKFKIIPNDR